MLRVDSHVLQVGIAHVNARPLARRKDLRRLLLPEELDQRPGVGDGSKGSKDDQMAVSFNKKISTLRLSTQVSKY